MHTEKWHEDLSEVLDILLLTKTHFHVPVLSNKFEDGISVPVWEWSPEKDRLQNLNVILC